MKYWKKCPLLLLMIITIIAFQVIIGVPKVLAFAEKQRNADQNYQVTKLEEYPDVSESDNQPSGNTISGNEYDVSGNQVSGNGVSGNGVSGNTVSGSSVSGNQVSGNIEDGNTPGADGSISGDIQNEGKSYEFIEVGDDYFADALFIGDSRTVGLNEYAGMDQATFYASTGLTVYKMFDSKVVTVPGRRDKINIEEALKQNQFKKIYFMIGINEMGTGTVESFAKAYGEAVARLRELQPDAIIYVQAIMKVSTDRSNKGDYINNEGIDARNVEIAKLADNETIFYIDVNEVVCDKTGGMDKTYTFDGVHLKAEHIPIWKEFLMKHAIVK